MNKKCLSVIACDKDGRAFVLLVKNPKWIPVDTQDIGTLFEPRKIWEIRSEARLLYQAPIDV